MTIGKNLVEVEEQLQHVMAGLHRFRTAAESLEDGRRSLDETAEQVHQLMEQAIQTLAPAVEAVTTLRRLDPDRLLGQVTAAASTVKQQLDRVERQQVLELDRTRQTVEKAVANVQQVSKELPASLAKVIEAVAGAERAVGANKTLLLAVGALLVVNTVLVIVGMVR